MNKADLKKIQALVKEELKKMQALIKKLDSQSKTKATEFREEAETEGVATAFELD